MIELIPLRLEMALIGVMMLDESKIPDVFAEITPDDFGDPLHRKIAVQMNKGIFNRAMLQETLNDHRNIQYLTRDDFELNSYEIEGNLRGAIKAVADFARRRVISTEGTSLIAKVQNEDSEVDTAYNYFINATTSTHGGTTETETALEVYEEMLNMPEANRILTGDYYFDNYHYKTGGSRRGQIEYILAITGHGKSQYAGFLEFLYAKNGNNILHFQFEDSKYSTMKVLRQYLSNTPMDREVLSRIDITDNVRTIQQIELTLRRYSAKKRVDVVVVDYVQNVRCVGVSDKRELVSEVSGRLRDLAKDFDCYVIAISQVSRDKTRKGYDSFPQLQDGKESSQIEQDAFMVTSIFRPNMVDELKVGERVKDIDGTFTLPYDSVWLRKRKDRSGGLDSRPILFEHTHNGFVMVNPEEARTAKIEKETHYESPF